MIIDTSVGRLIAFGDIHGHSHYLRMILKSIDPQPEDTLVFLGDYIDRGPDSKGVIDEIIALKEKCKVYTILGNHEEMVLAAHEGGRSDHQFWVNCGGAEALESYGVINVRSLPRTHLLFIANCVDYVESEDFIFVHAGCNCNVPLAENTGTVLRWDRMPKDPLPHSSGKTVVCGHTAQKTLLDLGHFLCIDTACGLSPTGRLTAIDLKSGQIWQFGGRNKKATIKQRKK